MKESLAEAAKLPFIVQCLRTKTPSGSPASLTAFAPDGEHSAPVSPLTRRAWPLGLPLDMTRGPERLALSWTVHPSPFFQVLSLGHARTYWTFFFA